MRMAPVFLSALALAATGTTYAATPLATASASLTNIQIELVDLTPEDGNTPFIIYEGWGWGAVQADAGSTTQGSIGMDLKPGGFFGLPIEPSQAQMSGNGYQVSAYRGDAELHASAALTGGSLNTNAYAWFASHYSSTWDPETEVGTRTGLFLLSPDTELRFSADYAISTSLSFADQANGVWAWADVALLGSLGETVVPNDGSAPYSQEARLVGSTWNGQVWGVGEQTGTLSLTLVNNTQDFQPLWIEARASANLTTPAITAVPEPGQFAMLLAGLGLVASVAIRRRGRSEA